MIRIRLLQKNSLEKFHCKRLHMNEVYILEMYNPDEEYPGSQSPILGVFNSKENAEVYRNEYIRDRYSIDEEDCSDQDLINDIYPVEFFINRYRVMS